MAIAFEARIENDMGVERVLDLPGRREVCGRCEGEGTILNPSIGEYAYSQEEFDEAFPPDSEEREHYFQRGGMYDVTCPGCQGLRVVTVLDREAMKDQPRRRLGQWRTGKSRARILERIESVERELAECRRQEEMERRYGA